LKKRFGDRAQPPGFRTSRGLEAALGPLDGIRVIEMAGMGPGPFAAMLLADLGADVIRVDRWSDSGDLPDTERRIRGTDPTRYVLHRGRRSLGVDLKAPGATELLLDLAAQADALIEGFRPGVMERLGLGPDACLARNPRLIYGRMTGWGQDGPLAATAGHDINYIALSGALHHVARKGERTVPPVNFVGDMGGGGLILAYGIVCALLAVARGGGGQVVDAAITDGSALLTAMLYGLVAQGRWSTTPGTNFADTGAPYYEVYETADGKHVAAVLRHADRQARPGAGGRGNAERPEPLARDQAPVRWDLPYSYPG
jgi:alpha-methylacyl-CoA racemase